MNIKQTPEAIEYQKEVTDSMFGLMSMVKKHQEMIDNYESDSYDNYIDDLPGEIWKDITGYEELYQVSNFGRVKSLKRYSGKNKCWIYKVKILKPALSRGYLRVSLSKNNTKILYTIHRLVAKEFVAISQELLDQGYTYDTLQVNHKDENKLNNHADNLEWCTPKYNSNYGTAKLRAILPQMKSVSCFDENGYYITSYPSITMASLLTGIPEGCIILSAKHEGNSAGGYLWEYYQSDHKKGYKLSDVYIRKIRLFRKQVSQFDKEGNWLNNYSSILEAAQINNIDDSSISGCISNKHNSAGGYIWKETKSEYQKGYKLPPEEIPKVGLSNEQSAKHIDIYYSDTSILLCSCKNMCEAANFLYVSRSTIGKILNKNGNYKEYQLLIQQN